MLILKTEKQQTKKNPKLPSDKGTTHINKHMVTKTNASFSCPSRIQYQSIDNGNAVAQW